MHGRWDGCNCLLCLQWAKTCFTWCSQDKVYIHWSQTYFGQINVHLVLTSKMQSALPLHAGPFFLLCIGTPTVHVVNHFYRNFQLAIVNICKTSILYTIQTIQYGSTAWRVHGLEACNKYYNVKSVKSVTCPLWFGGSEFSKRLPLCVS